MPILHETASQYQQDDLFGPTPNLNRGPAPGVRNSDDVTSRLAIDQVTQSGKRLEVNNKILRFLRQHPGRSFTYRELGRLIGHDAVDCMRRLNDLRHDGLVEKRGRRECSINGNLMTCWAAKRL